MITILQKQVFCLIRRVKVSMASNQMSQYHIQMWYHVTCYTRDFAPVKFERLGIWPRFFIKGAQSKFLWAGNTILHNKYQENVWSTKNLWKWHLMVERPKFWLVHRQFLSAEEAWKPIKDSVGFPWGGAAAKYLLSFVSRRPQTFKITYWSFVIGLQNIDRLPNIQSDILIFDLQHTG